ncbi:3-phosphoshikimate 1-carboxyvinyltransferase [candidate division KSB1 bacterium]|nr:3-phosphoshikimate 1-carboxyvinyltransferase [candidate division KSB1 bacterium]
MENHEKIIPGGIVRGSITVPGDKSISIRAILLSSVSEGTSAISGLSKGEDIKSALKCIMQLGIETFKDKMGNLVVEGKGMKGFAPLTKDLDCGNSGTTLRLLTGLLAGQENTYTLTGDDSLKKRPMERVITPLRKMGAKIECLESDYSLPFSVGSSLLKSIEYNVPVASAQVKSAILFAGMYADGITSVIETEKTRDHTELMLNACGVEVITDSIKKKVTVKGLKKIMPINMSIPGDISGASFFIVLSTLLAGSSLTIKNVGLNPTRSGVIDVLREMGADISVTNKRLAGNEETADLEIKSAELTGITIKGNKIPMVIDELPIIAVAGAFANGKTVICDASELRVKETDRIHALCFNLRKMGANVEENPDGLTIFGNGALHGSEFDSFGDHRIAMAFAVAACALKEESVIEGSDWADISFPGFYDLLNRIRGISQN